MALIVDAVGDLCLGLRNIFAKNLMFLIGTLSFLVGHATFIKGLMYLENPNIFNCIILGVVAGAILFYLLYRICTMPKMMVPIGIIYTSLICIFVCISLGVYINNQTIKNMLFMIGAVLFVSSDILLILYNFSKKQWWLHPVYSLLYFLAQIFISYSLHL